MLREFYLNTFNVGVLGSSPKRITFAPMRVTKY